MLKWEEEDGQLLVVGTDDVAVRIRGEGLLVDGPRADAPRSADEAIPVVARDLRLPAGVVHVGSLDRTRHHQLEPGDDPLDLPADEYLVTVTTDVETCLCFSGSATVSWTSNGHEVAVTFPEPSRAILGVHTLVNVPTETITVPPTPDGLAAALTHLAAAHTIDGPDRSHPTRRRHPPLLELGDALEVPESVLANTPDTGIELVVPPGFEPLFVSAPLAYYLGASVRTTDCESMTIRAPEVGLEYETSATLEQAVERLLRAVFFLDCLVRTASQDGIPLAEASILDVLDLDPRRLSVSTTAERLATYLEVPYRAVEHRLPDWHLSTYVTPDASTVEALPFLLDRLSLIFTPRTSALEGRELVERTLEDFYRSGARTVASVEVVKPELRAGLAHGWLADGVPIDVFKSTTEAYYNRLEYLKRPPGPTSICVVVNDPDMSDEHASVTAALRDRSDELSIDLTVEESLSTAALARLFETEYDFVHYVGHCETDGLRCPDGHLSTSSIDRCRVQSFFLNACGSFYEGMTLVEKGSVAGAVTLSKVLDDHALKVGTTFAKLLVSGFSIERALSLARRRIMMGKDYTVVGDGTHSLTPVGYRPSMTATVDPLEDGRFALTLDCYSTESTGSYYRPLVGGDRYAYLCGTDSTFVLGREELTSYLRYTELPVIFDGDLTWSTEVGVRLAADPEAA